MLRPVVLKKGRPTKCGAACQRATTVHCDCECGGKNHGQRAYYVHGDTTAAGRESFRKRVDEIRAAKTARVAGLLAAWAKSPAVHITHGGGYTGPGEVLILSREMSTPEEGPFRATTLTADGPRGHTVGTKQELAERISYSVVRPMTEAEVMAWTSTPEYARGAQAAAFTQAENTIHYLARETGRRDEATKTARAARELFDTDPDAAIEMLHTAISEMRLQAYGEVRAQRPVEQLPPLGQRFEPDLPLFHHARVDPGAVTSGFDTVEPTLLRFRREVPSVEAISLSTIFAGLTIMTGIATAERAFACVVRMYREAGRRLPGIAAVQQCITALGFHEQRRELYEGTAEWAPQVHAAMARGLRDDVLREQLYMQSELPRSIGLAKLSFVLALSGNDVCCLDIRILDRMFGRVGAKKWQGVFGRQRSASALKQYEAVEAAFLADNPFYRPGAPLAKARCQWMSWESVGNPPKPATHSAWADVVSEVDHGRG